MAVIKEFACLEHGEFVGSHPICPAMGCDSKHVRQEFRTAPKIRHSGTSRTDAGIRKSVDMYGLGNVRSAREGEASYGGDRGKELGMEVLWGNDVNKKMGRSFAELSGAAHKPLTVQTNKGPQTLTRNNAMREAATEMGITRRRIPKAGEVAGDIATPKAQAQALTV
jgi:hypothetical protein